jgi:hypothetical protein
MRESKCSSEPPVAPSPVLNEVNGLLGLFSVEPAVARGLTRFCLPSTSWGEYKGGSSSLDRRAGLCNQLLNCSIHPNCATRPKSSSSFKFHVSGFLIPPALREYQSFPPACGGVGGVFFFSAVYSVARGLTRSLPPSRVKQSTPELFDTPKLRNPAEIFLFIQVSSFTFLSS